MSTARGGARAAARGVDTGSAEPGGKRSGGAGRVLFGFVLGVLVVSAGAAGAAWKWQPGRDAWELVRAELEGREPRLSRSIRVSSPAGARGTPADEDSVGDLSSSPGTGPSQESGKIDMGSSIASARASDPIAGQNDAEVAEADFDAAGDGGAASADVLVDPQQELAALVGNLVLGFPGGNLGQGLDRLANAEFASLPDPLRMLEDRNASHYEEQLVLLAEYHEFMARNTVSATDRTLALLLAGLFERQVIERLRGGLSANPGGSLAFGRVANFLSGDRLRGLESTLSRLSSLDTLEARYCFHRMGNSIIEGMREMNVRLRIGEPQDSGGEFSVVSVSAFPVTVLEWFLFACDADWEHEAVTGAMKRDSDASWLAPIRFRRTDRREPEVLKRRIIHLRPDSRLPTAAEAVRVREALQEKATERFSHLYDEESLQRGGALTLGRLVWSTLCAEGPSDGLDVRPADAKEHSWLWLMSTN